MTKDKKPGPPEKRSDEGRTLIAIHINRRMSKSLTSELWIIDGTADGGDPVHGIGELAIVEDDAREFIHVVGGIAHQHTLNIKEDLTDFLLKRIEELSYLKGWLFFNWKDGSLDMDWEM